MFDLAEIGNRIRNLRIESKIDQDYLAEYLGISKEEVNQIENGNADIDEYIIDRISTLFCCPIDYILNGTGFEQRCSISFRTNNLDKEDLESLAAINKIVLNQIYMDRLMENY